MAVGSSIEISTIRDLDFTGVAGMGSEWYQLAAVRVVGAAGFSSQAFYGNVGTIYNDNIYSAWCPPGEVNYEGHPHGLGTWSPFGTGLPNAFWIWLAMRGTLSAIEFYACRDGDLSWQHNPAYNVPVSDRIDYLRFAPSFLIGGPQNWRFSKQMVKRGAYSPANMLLETQKLGIASDAADVILINPGNNVATIDTNYAVPTGGSAPYKFSNGSHTGAGSTVVGDSPAFAGDDVVARNTFFGISP